MSIPEQQQLMLDREIKLSLGTNSLAITLASGPEDSSASITVDAPIEMANRGSDIRLTIAADDRAVGK